MKKMLILSLFWSLPCLAMGPKQTESFIEIESKKQEEKLGYVYLINGKSKYKIPLNAAKLSKIWLANIEQAKEEAPHFEGAQQLKIKGSFEWDVTHLKIDKSVWSLLAILIDYAYELQQAQRSNNLKTMEEIRQRVSKIYREANLTSQQIIDLDHAINYLQLDKKLFAELLWDIWCVTADFENISKKPELTLQGPNTISSVAWSKDDKKVLIGFQDNTISTWDATTGQLLSTSEGHLSPIKTTTWSPDGTKTLTISENNTAEIWKLVVTDITQLCLLLALEELKENNERTELEDFPIIYQAAYNTLPKYLQEYYDYTVGIMTFITQDLLNEEDYIRE